MALEDLDLEWLPLLRVQLADLPPQSGAVEEDSADRPQLQVGPVQPPGREIYEETKTLRSV